LYIYIYNYFFKGKKYNLKKKKRRKLMAFYCKHIIKYLL
jgi:hypothetical protein